MTILGRTDKQKIQGRGIFAGRSASEGLFRPV
jgi:hypothetical protein